MNILKLLICIKFMVITLLASFNHVHADKLTVAVASNFIRPAQTLKTSFQKKYGHSIRLVTGASGLIYAQIKNGAPFDIFLSADQTKPEALEKENLAERTSRMTYAIGRLVLWSANPSLINKQGDILKKRKFRRLAIANPKIAPYGSAAREVLEGLNIANLSRGQIIYGNNILQTYQFAASGNADIGMISYSQIIIDGKRTSGSVWIIPEHLYSPIKQDAVLLNRAKNNPAAREFINFLSSINAKEIIKAYGYKVPTNNQ